MDQQLQALVENVLEPGKVYKATVFFQIYYNIENTINIIE